MSDDRNPEVEALIAEYGEDTVRAAFAIAQSIGRKGIRGIDFSGAASSEIRQHSWHVTKSKIREEVRKNLKG